MTLLPPSRTFFSVAHASDVSGERPPRGWRHQSLQPARALSCRQRPDQRRREEGSARTHRRPRRNLAEDPGGKISKKLGRFSLHGSPADLILWVTRSWGWGNKCTEIDPT
jgi:hypothetical protein